MSIQNNTKKSIQDCIIVDIQLKKDNMKKQKIPKSLASIIPIVKPKKNLQGRVDVDLYEEFHELAESMNIKKQHAVQAAVIEFINKYGKSRK